MISSILARNKGFHLEPPLTTTLLPHGYMHALTCPRVTIEIRRLIICLTHFKTVLFSPRARQPTQQAFDAVPSPSQLPASLTPLTPPYRPLRGHAQGGSTRPTHFASIITEHQSPIPVRLRVIRRLLRLLQSLSTSQLTTPAAGSFAPPSPPRAPHKRRQPRETVGMISQPLLKERACTIGGQATGRKGRGRGGKGSEGMALRR